MRYLLDVNALIAIGLVNHEFRERVITWASRERSSSFLTCSVTEMGFVRILGQAPRFGYTVDQARNLLLRMKNNRQFPFGFIPDGNDISHLPKWVNAPRQITAGHLLQLANANGATLATLDQKIPGAFVIA